MPSWKEHPVHKRVQQLLEEFMNSPDAPFPPEISDWLYDLLDNPHIDRVVPMIRTPSDEPVPVQFILQHIGESRVSLANIIMAGMHEVGAVLALMNGAERTEITIDNQAGINAQLEDEKTCTLTLSFKLYLTE